MPLDTKQIVALSFCGVSFLFLGVVLFAMYGPDGCGPSEDERQLLHTLNNLDTIKEHGGQVKKLSAIVNFDHDDKVYRYEAEILDYKNLPIGRLRGERVEGFATMRPRIMWYKTPGVPEEWQEPPRRGPGRRGGQGGPPRGERPPRGEAPENAPPPPPPQ